ncbi:PREDICTED: pumilio homolog 3-like [Amphimedon queenslandica]|uniref:PUM-HD domain-containing protein n=3 Tax=Amphimedon queenslandica TaxID=400682 RepID=A0AAN0IF57_AMPQE|nr:PREDICTED: pumilio homolog 3-like [Amphimedon queenslandica]|eukprot:XP_003387437.1 PREDICTED: pumilio homolog 3-like [Amphimedon queenslandica]
MAKAKVVGGSKGVKGKSKFKKASGSKKHPGGGKKSVKKNMTKRDKKKKELQKNKEPVTSGKERNEKRKLQDNDKFSVANKKSKMTAGKTNLTRKELDKKKLSVRRQRKLPADSLERINKAKQIWEHVRRHDMKKEERDKSINDMMGLISGNVYELSLKHDTARIIQCILKFGSQEMRNKVYDKLKGHVVELSKLRYAKFVIKALFRYSSPVQRSQLIKCYYNHVQSLVRHKEAVELVELAYNDYANASERSLLVQEFYGPQFAVFKDNGGRSLSAILAANPEEKTKLLEHMKAALTPLLDKSLVRHNIIHQAFLEFITHADPSSIADIMESLREVAVEMLHTREGAKVNLQCVWKGTAKDRKVFVKSLKSYIVKICKEEHGHLVLLGIFDCVDDTVLVSKTILTEIIASLEEICQDKHGRRVLLYLLNPRSPQHFSHQFLQLLTPGDSNQHSKKPQDIRWAELRAAISPPLIKLISENVVEWACEKPLAPLVIETVRSAVGDVTPIYTTLINEGLTRPLDTDHGINDSDQMITDLVADSNQCHLIGDPCGHWVLKKLIAINREDSTPLFSDLIIQSVPSDYISTWATINRGCFVLSSLLSEASKENQEKLKELLQSSVIDQLRTSNTEGASVLLKEL